VPPDRDPDGGDLRRLPLTLRPVPDELLESYLGRLAWTHGISYRLLLQHLRLPTRATKSLLAAQLTPADRSRLGLVTGLDAAQVTALTVTPAAAKRHRGWPSIEWHDWRSHPSSGSTQPTWACPNCVQESDGAILRDWLTGHLFVCVTHRCLLLDRCPNCNDPLVVPSPPCGQDYRRCIDFVARVRPLHVDDPQLLAAQDVYATATPTRTRLARAACSLAPFLDTIIDSGLGEPVMARLHRRAAALGFQHTLPEQGPAYMSVIAPELTTLARSVQRRRVVSPWELATEMADSLDIHDAKSMRSRWSEVLVPIATDILKSWWGPDGHRAWRAREDGEAWLHNKDRRRLLP
jgi:hypothetical protein